MGTLSWCSQLCSKEEVERKDQKMSESCIDQKLDFEAFKKNLMDVINEFQIKLGYEESPMNLYYPLESLNRLMDVQLSVDEMEKALEEFSDLMRETMGQISNTHEGKRFCIKIPEKGIKAAYDQGKNNDFLKEFIEQTRRCNCSIDDIVGVFKRYSQDVVCEKIKSEEFDYLLYFENGNPDDFRYCIKLECGHLIYHRFTPKEYEAL